MRDSDFVTLYPRLFHMTSATAWPMIERDGLHSVTSILDRLAVDPDGRRSIEEQRRPQTVTISDPAGGEFEIRDQKPLIISKLEACLTDMTAREWLRLLNRKVFFWPTEQRVTELLGVGMYRNREHLVLVINIASLVAAHRATITLAAINTGAVLYTPQPRGSATVLPIAAYPYEQWRTRRGPQRAIAEVAVDYAVPDILDHIVRVERRQHNAPARIIDPRAATP